MALQPLSVGDILMLSQTAWKIGRAFTHGKKSAPSEFAEVEREANGLSESLKLVAETLHSNGSVLDHADDETKFAVNAILQSAHKTLDDLDSFVDRYQVIKKKETDGGFMVERSWSDVVIANYKTFKWTTEGGDINELRNMLNMHTNSINLTMQALQSRSLARLEKTVVPMAENIASIHDRVQGDLGEKIDDLHRIIMAIANSSPTLYAKDIRGIDSVSNSRDSTGTALTIDSSPRLLEPPPPRSSSFQQPPRPLSRSPKVSSSKLGANVSPRSIREDSAYYSASGLAPFVDVNRMDWDFETGVPVDHHRPSIGAAHYGFQSSTSPKDSGYAATEPSSRRGSIPDHARRESQTLPALFKAVEDDYNAVAGASRSQVVPDSPDAPEALSVSPKGNRTFWRTSRSSGHLPPPAIPTEDEQLQAPATPRSVFSQLQRRKTSPVEEKIVVGNRGDFEEKIIVDESRPVSSVDRPPTARTVKRQSDQRSLKSLEKSAQNTKFERQLFRNAAILCDVRGRLVEHAQAKPDEPDPRYNVEMLPACQEARIFVIRKRENRENGGTKVATSIWCLQDDGEVRLQHKLSEAQETVPFCSYFEPEKVSIPETDSPCALKFHSEEWGAMLKEEIKTNWVNYYFASENDAVAFQSAVYGRTLLGSYRTTKSTVIHEGIKGAFAFEEQFANIEMLRLWEDDGVSTPGAVGGVMALMHISSNFGEGWARWWINCSNRQVKVKDDGAKHARVKGINITVVRPGGNVAALERARTASAAGAEGQPAPAPPMPRNALKKVSGVRIEFKTEEERSKFVAAAKRAQQHSIPLPDI